MIDWVREKPRGVEIANRRRKYGVAWDNMDTESALPKGRERGTLTGLRSIDADEQIRRDKQRSNLEPARKLAWLHIEQAKGYTGAWDPFGETSMQAIRQVGFELHQAIESARRWESLHPALGIEPDQEEKRRLTVAMDELAEALLRYAKGRKL